MDTVRYTKTSTFIFPLLEIPKTMFKCDIKYPNGNLKYNTRFLNSYLKNKEIIQYQTDHVFLLTRGYRDINFEHFRQSLIELPNYIDEYEKDEFVIYIFSIPEKNKKDFDILLNGGYSKISEDSKKLILKNHFFTGAATTIPGILYRSEQLIKDWEIRLSTEKSKVDMTGLEVWTKINLEKETLDSSIMLKHKTKSSVSLSTKGH